MLWLSRRPEWQRSREFETTTRTSTPGLGSRMADNSFGDDDEDDEDVPGKVKTRVVFQPTANTTHTIYYKGHWLRVRRGRKNDGSGCEMLSISVVARNNSILKQLVLQAKREYEAEAVHRIQIYFADSHGCWRWTDSRHKRPMSSIVLNPGVKEMLLSDTKDFLKSEKVRTSSASRIGKDQAELPSSERGPQAMHSISYIAQSADTTFTVVRGPWYTFPPRISPTRRARLREELPHPFYRRRAYVGHLRRIVVILLDQR